jgi:hypothetical protein
MVTTCKALPDEAGGGAEQAVMTCIVKTTRLRRVDRSESGMAQRLL